MPLAHPVPIFRRPPRTALAIWWRWLLLFNVCLLPAHAAVSKEYQLKAAFVYNFTKFTEWPANRFADETSPIIIGVIGQSPINDELAAIVQDRKVNGRSIIVRPMTYAVVNTAHVVFVASGEESPLLAMRESLRGSGVLTVGESEKFMSDGGIIGFTLDGDRLRFVVNLDASEHTGLKLSSQLLKLAVRAQKKQPRTP